MRYELQVTCIQEDSKEKWHYGYARIALECNSGEPPFKVADSFHSGLALSAARARSVALEKVNKQEDEYEKDVVSKQNNAESETESL